MENFGVYFFCFILSLLLIPIQLVVNAAAASEGRNGVYIVYTGPAASSSSSSSSAGFHCHHIMSSSSIKSLKGRVIHEYKNGFSGFAAHLSKDEAESIARRPEVVSVFPEPVYQLHTTRSWDFLKEQSNINFKPGRLTSKSKSSASGGDTIIGILDTGIWPEAKSFNDNGVGPIPKRWKGKCIDGSDFNSSNCNRKLIGAKSYVTYGDYTPRDLSGHGTHVAAIAAGRPISGASYHGLARGMARGGSPGSRIAVYQVCAEFGCDGSAVLKAFDDAIADGVDVINLSFGAYVPDFTKDPVAIGAFHAVENGIVVVSSAGNGGGGTETRSVENVAPWILTVGATNIDRFFESDIVLGNNKVIKGGGVHFANFRKKPDYPLTDGLSAKNSNATDGSASDCLPGSLDREKVEGKIVVCETNIVGEAYSIRSRHETVTSLGGIGAIYVDHYSQLTGAIYGASPMVAVDWQDAPQIFAYMNTTRNPKATILPTVVVSKYKPAPVVAYFSGIGPIRNNFYLIKPDVVAPGVDIISAWPSNITDKAFNILSGTSMASPHVTGIAALIKSQYPSWSPSAIKSAIMTTASQTNNLKKPITINVGNPADPFNMGAGEVTTSGPIQPGLVYETGIADYLLFLCNHGYNVSTIKLISSSVPAEFACPSNSREELISNMNYPSISVGPLDKSKSKKVKRTVTNVEESEESVYTVSIESTQDLIVAVNPATLHFTKEKKKLSYEATFRHSNMTGLFGYGHGSITWSNNKYRVRIPFTVIT